MASLLYLLLFGALIAGSMQINKLAVLMLQNASNLQHVLSYLAAAHGAFCKVRWQAVSRHCWATWPSCLVPFLAVAWLLSLRYKAILTGLSSRAMGKAYRLSRLGASGRFAALYKKSSRAFLARPSICSIQALALSCCWVREYTRCLQGAPFWNLPRRWAGGSAGAACGPAGGCLLVGMGTLPAFPSAWRAGSLGAERGAHPGRAAVSR